VNHAADPPDPRGVTIVELLATLGAMMVLGGLVAGGVASARTSARATRCLSNLRQLHIAAEAYHATSDAYPAAVLYHVETGGHDRGGPRLALSRWT
jgi:hypothetical protein